ncbi:hypothetical protein F2Q69_00013226 [Brassica cretica]|uniref:Uncharacterized protein n=1 Tax=Brassica cretica TaxID=69181 RepID=A0A8S9QPL6_BRACR|nr:hypothetical protein F2Q69_00013226 [Brassica cretica]
MAVKSLEMMKYVSVDKLHHVWPVSMIGNDTVDVSGRPTLGSRNTSDQLTPKTENTDAPIGYHSRLFNLTSNTDSWFVPEKY